MAIPANLSLSSIATFLHAAGASPIRAKAADEYSAADEPATLSGADTPSFSETDSGDAFYDDDGLENDDTSEPVRGASLLGASLDESALQGWALRLMDENVRDADRAYEEQEIRERRTGAGPERAPEAARAADDEGADTKPAQGATGGNGLAASEVTSAEHMARIEKEFGKWPGGGEEFLEQIPGSLFRSVLIKGVVALTNKRIVFLAYVPSQQPGQVLKAGAATIHRRGPLNRKLRPWLELRPDCITGYRSSSALYRPSYSCSLSEVRSILPLDPSRPNLVGLRFTDDRVAHIEYDTEEAARSWHNELVGALFHFRSTTDRLKVMIPHQRVERVLYQVMEGVARMMDIRLTVPEDHNSPACAEAARRVSDAIVEGQECKPAIALGYLLSHDPFAERYQATVDAAQAAPEEPAGLPDVLLELGTGKGITCPMLGDGPAGGPQADAESDAVKKEEDDPAQEKTERSEVIKRFVKRFALQGSPADLYVTTCSLIRNLPAYGSIAINSQFFCFWRQNYFSQDIRLRIPLYEIESVGKARAFGIHVYGLAIQVTGYPDVRLEFYSRDCRDKTIEVIRAGSEAAIAQYQNAKSKREADEKSAEKTEPLGQRMREKVVLPVGMNLSAKVLGHGFDPASIRRPKMHFVCLTIGSRGDVQPYISLGRRLMQDGHTVTIASHPEYRSWCESFGLQYKDVGGDPAALMKLSVEHPILSPSFFREGMTHFRKWLDDLFEESWTACQGADVLIQSPSTFAGIHVAEALRIPFIQAFTMPWTRTATYPQAFAAGADLGPSYNLITYSVFDNLIFRAMSGQVNRWRKKTLGLPHTNLEILRPNQTPFIYNFSPAVCPRPNDWKDHIDVTGYWFLDQPQADFKPSPELLAFIKKAKDDRVPLIYVGFGSITVPDAVGTTKAVYAATQKAGVRAIVVKGWSDRGSSKPAEPIKPPPEVFAMDAVPHDWLFPQIDAACHHGGAGTTGASLRFGLPTLIHPFFGDQSFWASRVSKLGAGVKVDSLTTQDLADAFKRATTDRVMKEKAAQVGEKIRSEDGVTNAVQFIYEHIPLAKKRCEERAERAVQRAQRGRDGPPKRQAPAPVAAAAVLEKQNSNASTDSGSSAPRPQWCSRTAQTPPLSSGSSTPSGGTPKRASTMSSLTSKLSKALNKPFPRPRSSGSLTTPPANLPARAPARAPAPAAVSTPTPTPGPTPPSAPLPLTSAPATPEPPARPRAITASSFKARRRSFYDTLLSVSGSLPRS